MFLNKDRGFSLIELTVSLGVTALTVSGAMVLTKSSLGLQNTIGLSDDLTEIANFVRTSTLRPGGCGLVPRTTLGDKTFANSALPTRPTDLTIDAPKIPVDLYLLTKTDDPITNKKSLKELFSNDLDLQIKEVELVLPEAVSSFGDGERITRGNIVVHLDKKERNNALTPLPFQVFETVVKLDVSGANARLIDCGDTWQLASPSPPVIEKGLVDQELGHSETIDLGKHSLCVVSDRGLKTGETKAGLLGEIKPRAQRANFTCKVVGPSATGNWELEVKADKEKGHGGRFNCQAFCI